MGNVALLGIGASLTVQAMRELYQAYASNHESEN